MYKIPRFCRFIHIVTHTHQTNVAMTTINQQIIRYPHVSWQRVPSRWCHARRLLFSRLSHFCLRELSRANLKSNVISSGNPAAMQMRCCFAPSTLMFKHSLFSGAITGWCLCNSVAFLSPIRWRHGDLLLSSKRGFVFWPILLDASTMLEVMQKDFLEVRSRRSDERLHE